jgi:hypothetical protein
MMDFMKTLIILILISSLNVLAKPKASDFKEVLSSDEAEVTEGAAASVEEEPKVVLKDNEQILSGSVRVLRKIDKTEVFFKDLKDSYFISSGTNYSSLFKAFDQSQKDGKPVSFKVNTKSRQVLSLESAPAKSTSAPAVDATVKGGPGSH